MLETHTLYRLETADGLGVYQQGRDRASALANDYFNERRRHPLPYDDALLSDFYANEFDRNRHKFAFASLEQFKFWFYRERTTLASYGARLHVIEAPAILGETQAIYDADGAVYVDELDLATV